MARATFFFLILFALSTFVDEVNRKVLAQKMDPSLTIDEKRLVIQQRKYFAVRFRQAENFVSQSNLDPYKSHIGWYRRAAQAYARLKKPVPIGLNYLQKSKDWTHLVDIWLEPIEKLGDGIYHVKIGEDHIALNLGEIGVPSKFEAGKMWYVPFMIVQLESLNVAQTVGGVQIHYAVLKGVKLLPDDCIDKESLAGGTNFLLIAAPKPK